jgi:phosphate transport system substrate-binding protein
VPFERWQLTEAVQRCKPGKVVEVPVYISNVIVVFNIGKTSEIYLTPSTLARIFNLQITHWRDPEIRRENPSITKFHGEITRVWVAIESGITEAFTQYLSEAAPKDWTRGSSEWYPVTIEAQSVASPKELVETLYANDGTITFLDASQQKGLKTVSIKTGNGPRDLAVPSPGVAARILETSPEEKSLKKSPYMLPFKLNRTGHPKQYYPLTLVSYLVGCTSYDSPEEAAAVRGLFEYAVGREGQLIAQEEAGADFLRGKLQKRAEAAVHAIEAGA